MFENPDARRRSTTVCTAVTAMALAAACAVPASAASAATENSTPRATESSVLSGFRSDLERSGSSADVTAFDALDAGQRHELASYFLDPEVAERVTDEAAVRADTSTTTDQDRGFRWGGMVSLDPARGLDQHGAAISAASRTSTGRQWFAFAGIRLTETKVSETYEYSGSTARRLLGYSCTVVRNIQPFTQVSSSKNSGYISGGQATSKCKVVVKRGVPTPWGTIAWSTYSSIQRLSARGNGAVTFNGWQ